MPKKKNYIYCTVSKIIKNTSDGTNPSNSIPLRCAQFKQERIDTVIIACTDLNALSNMKNTGLKNCRFFRMPCQISTQEISRVRKRGRPNTSINCRGSNRLPGLSSSPAQRCRYLQKFANKPVSAMRLCTQGL